MNKSFTVAPAFGGVGVWGFHHSKKIVVVSHFNLRFPDDTLGGMLFRLLICLLYILYGEGSVKVFGSLFFSF